MTMVPHSWHSDGHVPGLQRSQELCVAHANH